MRLTTGIFLSFSVVPTHTHRCTCVSLLVGSRSVPVSGGLFGRDVVELEPRDRRSDSFSQRQQTPENRTDGVDSRVVWRKTPERESLFLYTVSVVPRV